MNVFIVDDDSPLVHKLLDEMIDAIEGVKLVGVADDAQMALDVIPIIKPDVVILDIHLPEGNGIDLLKKFKNQPISPWIIMFTTFPCPQYRQKCLQAGADYFIDKTAEFDCIPLILKKLCSELKK